MEPVSLTLASYRADLERYERELEQARERFAEDHPLVRLWLRRRTTAERMIEYLEERR